jgi:hypothetical protein
MLKLKYSFIKLPKYPKCPGCQRRELHKFCPAYGTPYYMSGIPYTKELEEISDILKDYHERN